MIMEILFIMISAYLAGFAFYAPWRFCFTWYGYNCCEYSYRPSYYIYIHRFSVNTLNDLLIHIACLKLH